MHGKLEIRRDAHRSNTDDADDADEDVMIIRISIPSGLNFTLKPGMKAVVKFAMNG